jgi:hypothetical protein
VNGIVVNKNFVVSPSIIGGTSASTPVFAGMVALLSQYLGATNGLGNINRMLYKLAATQPNNYFNQLTSGDTGNNQVYCSLGTPSNQTLESGLICPPSGVLGFFASNSNTTTGYNLVTGLGSVDLGNLAPAWAAARTASTVTLQASPTSINFGQSVTLTATVTPSTALGQITFYVTGQPSSLGVVTLNSNGVATLTTAALPVGADTVNASFPGDGYNQPNTGSTIVDVTAPDFTLTNTGSTSATVLAGVAATGFAFSVTPAGGATTFASAVSLSCSGIDATMGCNFSLNPIPAGSGSTSETLTITTSGPNTAGGVRQQHRRADNRSPWIPLSLPLAGMVLAGLVGRGLPLRYKIVGLCMALALTGLLVACGGGSSSPPPVGVAVTPSTASLWPNNIGPPAWPSSSQAFAATVTNATNTAVTWSITPSTAGSIDTSGNYTAPQIVAGLPGSVTITATSQADSTKSGIATVTLKPATVPGRYTVTVSVTESATTKPLSPSFALTVN